MKLKTGNRFSMKAAGNTAEILIYEEIGAGWLGGISAKQFAADLKALGDVSTINLRLNSPGGDVFDGVAIYNQLVQHKADVNVFIDGLAASIASIIAMAGESIQIAENAMMMIHNPWALVIGDARDMNSMAATLDKIKETMIATYAKRSQMSAAEVSKLMDGETWMAGQEAVDQGFADSVMQLKEPAAKAVFDLSHFKNAPAELKEPQASEEGGWVAPPEFYRQRLALYQRAQ